MCRDCYSQGNQMGLDVQPGALTGATKLYLKTSPTGTETVLSAVRASSGSTHLMACKGGTITLTLQVRKLGSKEATQTVNCPGKHWQNRAEAACRRRGRFGVWGWAWKICSLIR